MHVSNSYMNFPQIKNQLVLFVSDISPSIEWQQFAEANDWEMLYHDDLFSVLGAFVMLMPGVIVVDRTCKLGNEALYHLEDVLVTAPQSPVIIVEIGTADQKYQRDSITHIGVSASALPLHLISQLAVNPSPF